MDLSGKIKRFFGFEDYSKRRAPAECYPPNHPFHDHRQNPSDEEIFSRFFGEKIPQFFFFRPHGGFPAEHYDDKNEHHDHIPGPNEPQTFFYKFEMNPGHFWSFGNDRSTFGEEEEDSRFGAHSFPGSSHHDDIFRHFDEMFQEFEKMFGSMGLPGGHGVFTPSIGPPPAEDRDTLRDKMLKQPDTGPGHSNPGGGTPRGTSPRQDNRTGSSIMDRLFATPTWDSSTHKKMDSDLDEAVKSGNLDAVLGPRGGRHSPRFSPHPWASPSASPQPHPHKASPLPEDHPRRVSVRTYRNINGNQEERQTVEDEYGSKEETVTRTIDGQTHTVITRSDLGGKQQVSETFTNMEKGDKGSFDDRWHARAGSGPLRMDKRYENILSDNMTKAQKETTSDFKKLFRLGFHGFNSSHRDFR